MLSIIMNIISACLSMAECITKGNDTYQQIEAMCNDCELFFSEEEKWDYRKKCIKNQLLRAILVGVYGCIIFTPLTIALLKDFGVYNVVEPFCDIITELLFKYFMG